MISKITVSLNVDSTTFLDLVGDYLDSNGFITVDLDRENLTAKKNWPSASLLGPLSALSIFNKVSIRIEKNVADISLSSKRMMVLFYTLIPLWAVISIWWIPIALRLFIGVVLSCVLYGVTLAQGILRVNNKLKSLAL